jgi:hypothetical protein
MAHLCISHQKWLSFIDDGLISIKGPGVFLCNKFDKYEAEIYSPVIIY